MFILKHVTVNKYKSYASQQEIQLESDITTLVGKNESGKTAFLELLAKFNYFTDDKEFKFDEIQDYPRNELKKYQRSGRDQEVIVCTFQLDKETISKINTELGEGVLTTNTFTVAARYKSGYIWHHLNSNEDKYFEGLQRQLAFSNGV